MALTLAVVETAIEALIAGGQSFSVDGLTFSQASLPSLWEARKQLKAESDRSTRPTIRGVNFGSMGYGDSGGTEAEVQATLAVTP